jgi:cytochrome c-type biogenesis protein
MEFSFPTVLVVPLALGLLGFIEPCTVGGHLVFLRAVTEGSRLSRLTATLTFALSRTFVMGAFGAVVGLLGERLIDVQTGLWLVFGVVYVVIGVAFGAGQGGYFKRRMDAGPSAWKMGSNPVLLGIAFGLSIPACAAPILFGLIGLVAGSGAVMLGFATMAVFALALSLPLAALAVSPFAMSLAGRLAGDGRITRWVVAIIFIVLGLWSLWFGLFVDPENWASL